MNTSTQPRVWLNSASVALGSTIFLLVAGCVSEPEPRYGAYRQPVQVVQQPAYIYYPDYEVYYSNVRHEYVYFDGRIWVSRRNPPRQWAREIRRAPYVQLEFNDAPDRHHQDVVRRYPRHRHDDHRRDDDDRRR